MKKSFTQTLVLVAVLGGLLTWYFVVEKKVLPGRKEAEENGKRLVQTERDQIQEIEIVRRAPSATSTDKTATAVTKTILKKVGTDWSLVEPVEDASDSSNVSGLLSTLVTVKQDRVVDENPKDVKAYGLEDPAVKVLVRKNSTAPAEEIWIGDNTPVGSSSYVRLGNKGPVYRAAQTLKASFDKDANSFRSKAVVTVPRFDVQEIEIQNSTGNIVVKKTTKDAWLLLRDDAPAETNEVNKTLNALVDLKATEFATEKASDLSTYGLKSPAVRVTLTKPKDTGKQTILFGKAKGKVYAKRDDKPTVYQVDPESLKPLERKGEDYRDLTVARFNRFDVSKIVLDRGQEKLELQKNGKDWVLANENNTALDAGKVDGLLTALQDAKAVKFFSAKDKVTKPTLTVRVFEKDKDNAKVELAIDASSPTAVRVQRTGLDTPVQIKAEDWKKISLGKSDLIPTQKSGGTPKAGSSSTEKKSTTG